jgi:predicted nuclease of restriction endonuclease-like (RecB) superfamily
LTASKIQQPDTVEFSPVVIAKPSQTTPFTLSWTHYVLLLTVKDPGERSFYEIEAASEGWSIPELKRQVAACLYERLALSRSKTTVRKLAHEGQIVMRPEDILKEPYVLEFLGLDERTKYSENDLETAIINRLEHLLAGISIDVERPTQLRHRESFAL